MSAITGYPFIFNICVGAGLVDYYADSSTEDWIETQLVYLGILDRGKNIITAA